MKQTIKKTAHKQKNSEGKNKMFTKTLTTFLFAITLLFMTITPTYAITVELMSTNPAPIVAGEYADVTFRFSKDATDTLDQDISFRIKKTEFITPISEQNIVIKGLSYNEDVTRTMRVYFSDELAQGYINLETELVVNTQVIKKDLQVFIDEEQSYPELLIGSIVTTPSELLADTDDNEILVTVQNLGDKDAKLVRADLETKSQEITTAYAYSFSDSVSTIAAGEEAEFKFVADIEEDAREPIDATLVLRYRAEKNGGNTYETFERSIPFVIPIQASPYLEVTNVEQLDSFETGSTENRVRISVTNNGVKEAKEVRVRVVPDISYPFIFELTTEYVASKIQPGETVNVEFTMEVLKDAQIREYPMTVRLESLVGESRYTREDTIVLEPTQGRKMSTTSIATAIVIVVFITAIVLGLRMRQSKKKTK